MGYSYILGSLTFSAFILVTALYLTRTHWLPHLPLPTNFPNPLPSNIYTLLPTTTNPHQNTTSSSSSPSTFTTDIEAGFSSRDFDLQANNLDNGDERQGLEETAKREVGRIMQRMRVGFDEARRIYVEQRFKRNGIGVDGRPRDPKFVSFS